MGLVGKPSFAVSFAALLGVALAGCLGGGSDTEGEGPLDTSLRFPAPPLGVPGLDDLPVPALDGEALRQKLAAFVEEYAPRISGTPGDDAATAWLVAEFEALGYEVQVLSLRPDSVRDVSLTTIEDVPTPRAALKAIVAKKAGNVTPDHWIAWGGHYDTSVLLGPPDTQRVDTPAGSQPRYGYGLTLQGAYDNGSGTLMTLELARLLADVETNRTRAAILFNGEEEGLLASEAFVDWYRQQTAFTIDHFTGFDMVGINWPAPHRPLLGTMGQAWNESYMPVMQYVVHDVVGVPRNDSEAVQFFPRNHRNSDELNFDRAGIPTMRFAGMILAADYWAYHKANDTMATIHRQAGGAAAFAMGLETVAAAAYWSLLAVDRMDVRVEAETQAQSG